MEKNEGKKIRLQDGNGNFCGHYHKGEMDDGMIVCLKCGVMVGRCYGGSVGYNFKNHTMRGEKRK